MTGIVQSLFPMMKNREKYNTVGSIYFVDESKGEQRKKRKICKEPALISCVFFFDK